MSELLTNKKHFILLLVVFAFTLCGEDYYQLLGVDRKFAIKDLKSRFRKLSAEYHPDKNPNGSEMFIKINKAFETLSDPEKRKIYDIYGEEGLSQNKFSCDIVSCKKKISREVRIVE